MKRYSIIIIALIVLGSLNAGVHENAGEYGYQFLEIPFNPVSMALAGRGVHSADNNASWILQPASNCLAYGKNVAVSHSIWIGDTAFSTAAYSYSKRSSHLGLALRNLSYGEIEKRDETGFLIGYYEPVDIAVNGNYSLRLKPWLYAGANLGVIYQKLDTASSLALGADLGLTLLPPLEDSAISLAFRNLGVSNDTDEEAVKLPHSLDLDLYKGFNLAGQKLGLEASLFKTPDADLRYTVSAEVKLLERLSLRGGYKLNYDAEGLTAGLGIAISRFVIDYGFAAFEEGLEDVHSFGLSYNF